MQFLKLDTKYVMRQQPKLHIYSTEAGKYIFMQPILSSYFKKMDWIVQCIFLNPDRVFKQS